MLRLWAIFSRSRREYGLRSAPFGRYCCTRPLVPCRPSGSDRRAAYGPPPAARGPPGMTREAVWRCHQKAIKAGSVVHFVTHFILATSARHCQKSQIRAELALRQRSSAECRFKGLKNFQDGHSAPRRQAATPTSCTTSSAPADVFAVARKASDMAFAAVTLAAVPLTLAKTCLAQSRLLRPSVNA